MKLLSKIAVRPATCCWLLLLVSCLGACQRASYQFQPLPAATYQALPSAPAADGTALVSAVRLPAPISPLGGGCWRPARGARRPARQVKHDTGRATKLPIPTLWASGSTATQLASQRRPPQQAPLAGEPVRSRSRTVAIILAALSISYIPLSLHNFYLGYYGRGALAIALLLVGFYLLLLGSPGFLFGGSRLLAIGYVGIAMLAGWFFWQLTDLFRIISRDLQPKNAEYKSRTKG